MNIVRRFQDGFQDSNSIRYNVKFQFHTIIKMNNVEVIKTINDLLIDCIEVTQEQIIPSANFYKIGRDSLDYVWLYAQVEKTFGFKITVDEIVKVKTVEDFYNYVIRKNNQNQ